MKKTEQEKQSFPENLQGRAKWVGAVFLAILITGLLSGYFRICWYWDVSGEGWGRSLFSGRRQAETVVYETILGQVKTKLSQLLPQVPEPERARMAVLQAKEIIRSGKKQFDQVVANTRAKMLGVSASSAGTPYLLEADSYYYYYLTEQISRTGRISGECRNGRYYDPNRQIPQGAWPWMSWHPYLGYFFYRLLLFLKPGISMMKALCYFPVAFSFLLIPLFYLLCRLIRVRVLSAFIGALALMLSPIFIQRSAFGWYDTDLYNFLFPLSVLILQFAAIRNSRRAFFFGALAGVLTGLYPLFWQGWPFIFILTVASSFLYGLFQRLCGGSLLNASFRFLTAYVPLAMGSACFFITPFGLYDSLLEGGASVFLYAREGGALWPNVFLTVGESQAISLKKLIYLTGNYVTCFIALIGALISPLAHWRRNGTERFLPSLILLCFAVPLYLLSLQTERFSLLLVLPMALLTALGAEQIRMFFESLLEKCFRNKISLPWGKGIAVFLVLALALPLPLVTANVVGPRIRPIMNDTWFQVLSEIKKQTSRDAVVHSWWPPGYFVLSIAGRKVSSDGGSQHLPVMYWVARAFLSIDERESAGIFRMINAGGNEALVYLQSLGVDIQQAVSLVLKLVVLSRAEAGRELSGKIAPDQSEKLLSLTHGTGDRLPSYVLIYDDLITQNVSMQLIGRWDFDKAREIQKSVKPAAFPGPFKLARRGGISGGFAGEAFGDGIGSLLFDGFRKLLDPLEPEEHLSKEGASREFFSRAAMTAFEGGAAAKTVQIRSKSSLKNYIRNTLFAAGGVLKYTAEASLAQEQGPILSFDNGLRVDRSSMDSFISVQDGKVRGKPISLFNFEEGHLVERPYEGERLDVSALLFERDGKIKSLFADRSLIRSLLFRLYYLGGKGLSVFKPFLSSSDPATKTVLCVYQIDWAMLETEKTGTKNFPEEGSLK